MLILAFNFRKDIKNSSPSDNFFIILLTTHFSFSLDSHGSPQGVSQLRVAVMRLPRKIVPAKDV